MIDPVLLSEIRDFLQDISTGAPVTDASRDHATEFVACLDGLPQSPGLWQPIETAPKDGTQILATWADSWPKSPHMEAVYQHGGVWYYAYDGDAHGRPPTHWMPMPQGPDTRPDRTLQEK